MSEHVLAVDIGGTKIAAGVVDRAGRVVRQAVRATREPVFTALRDAVTAIGPGPVAAVGLSCAGPVDAVAGTVSPINIPTWRDFPLCARMAELVTGVPIALAGDGQCMALGEHWLGAGRGAAAMLGMVVSTGVGGGLVLDGRPFAGRSGNAGHIGHVIADPAGERCSCGARGCVETVASGPNLVRWALDHGWTPPANIPNAAAGETSSCGTAAAESVTTTGEACPRDTHSTTDTAAPTAAKSLATTGEACPCDTHSSTDTAAPTAPESAAATGEACPRDTHSTTDTTAPTATESATTTGEACPHGTRSTTSTAAAESATATGEACPCGTHSTTGTTAPTAAKSLATTGEACPCGARGSTGIAAPTAAAVSAATTGEASPGSARGSAGIAAPTAVELAAAAAGGDPVALAAFRRGAHALGLGVVAAAALCDLEVVVIGGGVAKAGDVLFEPLRRAVAEHAGLSYLANLRVLPATLGTGAGLAGAAALAFHTL